MEHERADLRSARICAVLANIHRGPDTEPFSAADFMPRKAGPPQTWEEQLRLVELWNAALGGDDHRTVH